MPCQANEIERVHGGLLESKWVGHSSKTFMKHYGNVQQAVVTELRTHEQGLVGWISSVVILDLCFSELCTLTGGAGELHIGAPAGCFLARRPGGGV